MAPSGSEWLQRVSGGLISREEDRCGEPAIGKDKEGSLEFADNKSKVQCFFLDYN